MARPQTEDLLQSHRFWLLDLKPSQNPPFFVMGGVLAGFASCTMPEVAMEYEEIKQVNQPLARRALVGASIGPMSLSRGARAGDSSFYQWVRNAIHGFDVVERDLLLVQYHSWTMAADDPLARAVAFLSPTKHLGSAFDMTRVPVPARAWFLGKCSPVRYKAGSDFDAKEAEISMMELDLQPSSLVEISLGAGVSAVG